MVLLLLLAVLIRLVIGTGLNVDGNGSSDTHKDVLKQTANELIKEKVSIEMEHLTSPEAELSYGVTETSEDRIKNNIQSFEIEGGPADVTSYHDFYRLQIAFEHVWTELFDKEILNLGKQLYKEWVKLKDFSGDTPAYNPIRSIDDLRILINEVRSMGESVAENDPRYAIVKIVWPDTTPEYWASLNTSAQNKLYELALPLLPYAQRPVAATRLEKLLNELDDALSEKYKFDIFAPNSINYGVLATYRQEWKPLNYQVGNLVSTIPLAPQEIRRYTKKLLVKKSRNVKEADNSLKIRKTDSSDTSRADREIVEKAFSKTSFNITANESFGKPGAFSINSTQGLNQEGGKDSTQTKKDFRESILKCAQEYKEEHRMDIDTTESQESEETISNEIRNPNDEITVTYLFYELQRTYEISEMLHKLTPVILVANDVPAPHEIDESWIIRYSWILKRVALDDSFISAIDYLSKNFVGAETSLEILRINMERQAKIVEKIGEQIKSGNQSLSAIQSALDAATEKYASSKATEGNGTANLMRSISDPLGLILPTTIDIVDIL